MVQTLHILLHFLSAHFSKAPDRKQEPAVLSWNLKLLMVKLDDSVLVHLVYSGCDSLCRNLLEETVLS